MAKKKKSPGKYPRVDVEAVMALIARHGLSVTDLAQLSRSSIQSHARSGSYQSRTVSAWISGERGMPQNVYELIEAKLWLVDNGHATLNEVMDKPLAELLLRMHARGQNELHK